ncbi:MAG: hypothetical protein M2R45_02336 [Verrucomicrobia subdivision 3 bacterium]|nr:hypothetical protein [Limisphaerales bacterium]MCS1414888.1 hypothetical protein [Limisphaerales bacterium]
MQTAATEIVDLAKESAAAPNLYRIDDPEAAEFSTWCLVESGVRFVQLHSGDTGGWDTHKNMLENHILYCLEQTNRSPDRLPT